MVFDKTTKNTHKSAAGDTSGDEDYDNADDWTGSFEKKAAPDEKNLETWYFRECSKEQQGIHIERWVLNITMLCMRAYSQFKPNADVEAELLSQYEMRMRDQVNEKRKEKSKQDRRD